GPSDRRPAGRADALCDRHEAITERELPGEEVQVVRIHRAVYAEHDEDRAQDLGERQTARRYGSPALGEIQRPNPHERESRWRESHRGGELKPCMPRGVTEERRRRVDPGDDVRHKTS